MTPLPTVEALIARHREILRAEGKLTPEGWREVAARARRTLAGRTGTRRPESIPASSYQLVLDVATACEVEADTMEREP